MKKAFPRIPVPRPTAVMKDRRDRKNTRGSAKVRTRQEVQDEMRDRLWKDRNRDS